MTIGSSNITWSGMASEIGATSNSNVSMKDISGRIVKNNKAAGTGFGSTYALAKEKWLYGADSTKLSSTVTSAQGTGKAGLNTAPYSASEWVGFNHVGPRIGSTSIGVAKCSVVDNNAGCITSQGASINLYCKKSGDTISIYVNVGDDGNCTKVASNGSTWTNVTAETEIAQITALTSGHLPTGCSMSAGAGGNSATASGTAFTTGQTLSTTTGGATSTTNLGGTKIGYKADISSWFEGGNNANGSITWSPSIRFNWTWPTSPSGDSYTYGDYTDVVLYLSVDVQHSNAQWC